MAFNETVTLRIQFVYIFACMKIGMILLGLLAVISSCQKEKSNVLASSINTAICDTSQVSYQKDIKPILSKNCYNCHAGSSPLVGNIDFSDYSQISSLASDSPYYIYNVITYNPRFKKMPPLPATKLDTCDILKIKKWTEAGAPDN
jgi:hypothetical protein